VSQGLTTAVGGPDGRNARWPLSEEVAAYERQGIAMNEVLTIDDPRVTLIEQPPTFRVVAAPRPFSTERVDLEVPEGGTILDILRAANVREELPARVFVGDVLIPRAWWARVRPKRGSVVTIRAIPTGGGNGDSNKTLRTVLQIVVVILVVVVSVVTQQYYGIGWAIAAGAAVSIAGNLAIMALLPPPYVAQPSPS
jgi:hypothetical protein